MKNLHPWVTAILVNPLTKNFCKPEAFNNILSVIDARVFLKNTYGYSDCAEGQDVYKNDAKECNISLSEVFDEIEGARPTYPNRQMAGRTLDCGGEAGTDNGLAIDDKYWQPRWKDMVCYVCARKPN